MLARRGALLGARGGAGPLRRVVAYRQPPPPLLRQPRAAVAGPPPSRRPLAVLAFTQQPPHANDAPAVPPTWRATDSAPNPLPLPPSLAPLGAAFDAALERYWRDSHTARAVVDAMWRTRYGPSAPLHHDHLAFRTFGVPGHGVAALGAALRSWGYVPHDEGGKLVFPKKKLRAAWFSPPPGLEGALPRIFVSELVVSELSPAAAAVIRRYAGPPPPAAPAPSPLEVASASSPEHDHPRHHHPASSSSSPSPSPSASTALPNHPDPASSSTTDQHLASAAARAWTCVVAGGLPWQERPSLEDWSLLANESEYAAWVLAHGYSLNHTALAVHRLDKREALRERTGQRAPPPSDDPRGERSSLASFAEELRSPEFGFQLNDDGGAIIKASPGDSGLLLQCSTVADVVDYEFAGGRRALVPGAYLEFVERRPLPRFAQLPRRDLREWHRRDGFEQASADSIFASTTLAAGGSGVGGGEERAAATGGALGGGASGTGGGAGGGQEGPSAARALPKSASSGASGSGA
jgi:uncharacterized membrane protein YgcG